MFIANFDEFNQYLDSLLAQNSIKYFASYHQALVESKVKRKAKIADISKEINKLLKQIESARTKIKQATAAEDKKFAVWLLILIFPPNKNWSNNTIVKKMPRFSANLVTMPKSMLAPKTCC